MKGETNSRTSGGGTLYVHNIDLGDGGFWICKIQIITNDSTPFTEASLISYLYNKGFTDFNNAYSVIGTYNDFFGDSKNYNLVGIWSDGTQYLTAYASNKGTIGNDYYPFNNDMVVPIS